MIFINKKIKLITLFIAIIILFNFIMLSQKVHAIDPITLTLGALYTYEVAKAIYLTALAAAGVGVTFLAWEEAKKFHDIVEGTSPAPLNYPGWERAIEQVKQSKADLAQEQWFSQWGLEVLPGGNPDPEPGNNNKRGILAFMGATGIIGGFINNFISMFQKLELEKGENIGIGDIIELGGTRYIGSLPYIIVEYPVGYLKIRIGNGELQNVGAFGTNYTIHRFELNKSLVSTIEISFPGLSHGIYTRQHEFPPGNRQEILDLINGEQLENHTELYKLNYDGGSLGEIKYPQPNLIPIPRHKPTTTPILNPDGTPIPGIQSILNPDGSIEERFYGDIDDLLRDIVMNTPIDKILNPDSRPYEIKPGPDHIKITYPDQKPTVPYPQPPLRPDPGILPGQWPGPGPYPFPDPRPEPDPYPSPDLPPGIKPGEYPGPGPYPWPDPYVDPNPSPHTPVEPGKQIDYTPWLKIIINWLSIIWNKIPVLPDVEVDPDTPDLFSPDPNYIKDKIQIVQSQINDKLNLPDLTPLPALFDGIKCEPIPDGYIGDNKVFDASYVNDLASTIAYWQRFLWWIVIILIGANNAYKLIRGTDLITIYGRGGKGN